MLKGKKGIKTVLTRTRDENVSLGERRRISNFWDTDLFISIHVNSAPNREVNHSEVYYADTHSQWPARIFREELQRGLNNGRGFVRRRRYAVIRQNFTRVGAVLVESMYLSNTRGEAYLRQKANQKKIAQILFRGIERIIEGTK
jgi:N-acetylmuramoyl-L-alanine amidase